MSDYDRDLAIRKAIERDALVDAQISNKISAHQHNQFGDRFPKQVEHCLRLVGERLQLGLKKEGASLTNEEVAQLAGALEHLYSIWRDVRAK